MKSSDKTEENKYGKSDNQNKKKTSKKILIIGVLFVAFTAVMLLLASLLHNPFKESFDLLFFNTDEALKLAKALSRDGMGVEYEMTMPTNSLDLSFTGITRNSGDFKGRNAIGTFEIYLGSKGKDAPFTVAYSRDKISICTTAAEDRQVITIPRKNTRKGLETSIFHPDSNSKYALDNAEYENLLKILSALETGDEDTQRDSFKKTLLRVAKKVIQTVDIKRSYSFEGFGIYKTTTVTLDSEDLRSITDILLEETESNPAIAYEIIYPELILNILGTEYNSDVTDIQEILHTVKNMTGEWDLNASLSYTESGGRLNNVKLDVSYMRDGAKCCVCMNVAFEYSDTKASFELTLDRTTPQGTDTARLGYVKETDKKEKTSLISARLFAGAAELGLDLEYDAVTGEYSFEFSRQNGILKLGGECSFNKKDGALSFDLRELELKGIKIKAEPLIRLSLYSTKEMPDVSYDGVSLFEINEADFARFYREIEELL